MSVIVELRVPGEDFELGQILRGGNQARIELETMVPAGERTVPFFWVYDDGSPGLERSVREHPSVEGIRVVDTFDDRTLYALEWRAEQDRLLEEIREQEAQLLSGALAGADWDLELRFPSKEDLSAFHARCEERGIRLEIGRLYNPSRPERGEYGLTDRQRDALVLAITRGYYDIPREVTTVELAEEFGISDQAVTERLRRAIVALASNTLLASDE